jgi:hypothetical protein
VIKKLLMDDIEIKVEKCVYKDDIYSLVEISKELLGTYILSNAIYNGVLNLNALYKNFIDDNFEHDVQVQDHQITETLLDNGSLYLCMSSLDENKKILSSHCVEINPIT